MKTAFKILSVVLFLTIASCQNSTENKQEEVKSVEKEVPAQHQEHILMLDGEKRWQANPETTQGIQNISQLVNNFTATPDSTSYKTLETSIDAEFQMIFQKCTMKGEAHNQLHNYLLPLKKKFQKLSSNDPAECKNALIDLKEHLAVYAGYFE